MAAIVSQYFISSPIEEFNFNIVQSSAYRLSFYIYIMIMIYLSLYFILFYFIKICFLSFSLPLCLYNSFVTDSPVELRKQISGYQTSLLTCNRKAAVKIRVQIATVNARLIDCVNDAIEIKKSNSANVEKVIETDGVTATATATAVAVTVADVGSKQGFLGGVVKEEEEEVVITNSVVDRGAELLHSILANGRPLGTIEETWERIILSEKMRFSLQDLYGVENSRNIDIIENARRNMKTVSTANNEAVPTTIETIHSSTYNDKANLPLTYVSYINNCFNSIKRLAAVEKVEKN